MNQEMEIALLKEKQAALEKTVHDIRHNVQKILFYVHNDDKTGEPGLVAEVRSLKEILQKEKDHREKNDTEKAVWSKVWGAIAGFVGASITFIVNAIFDNFSGKNGTQ